MKRLPHILNKMATLLLCTLTLSSCLKEDMSNCPEQIRVYFTFSTRAAGSRADVIDPVDVDRMNLYVFDSKGYFLEEYRDDNIPNFSADYFMDASDLLPGKYRFVAWAGKDEICYATSPAPFVKGATTFDEALLMLKRAGNTVSTAPHPLFHAMLATATVTTQKIQRFDMPLTQLTNIVNIRTVGLPSDANAYTFNIADNNDTYKFDKSFATPSAPTTFTYTAPCAKDGANQLNSTLTVMRLAADRHAPQLEIYNQTTGVALYPAGTQSGDLIGLILSANPQNDFETTHVYDIVITFTGDGSTNFKVSITINGWQVHDQGSDLIEE